MYNKWKSGEVSNSMMGDELSRIWRGLPHSSGGTYPDQYAGRNAAHMSRSEMMAEMERIKKMQTGGVANLSGASGSSSVLMSKSQEMFAQKIADAVTPIVVPVGGGGGGGAGVQIMPDHAGGTSNVPQLPSADSSIVAMEYKYRITMGASV